jgi:hypothetical protein
MVTPTNKEDSATLPPRVLWSDVMIFAPDMFEVWHEGSEVRWAEQAWRKLAEAGLTGFNGEVERTRVLVRFVGVAAFYHSWCQATWQEGYVMINDWARGMALSVFRLGQLAGPHFFSDVDLTDDELSDELLREVTDQEYDNIVAILASSGEAELFTSLWLSREPACSNDEVTGLLYETVNEELSDEKFAGYAWITGGCCMESGE